MATMWLPVKIYSKGIQNPSKRLNIGQAIGRECIITTQTLRLLERLMMLMLHMIASSPSGHSYSLDTLNQLPGIGVNGLGIYIWINKQNIPYSALDSENCEPKLNEGRVGNELIVTDSQTTHSASFEKIFSSACTQSSLQVMLD
jgi:hypothetical protein